MSLIGGAKTDTFTLTESTGNTVTINTGTSGDTIAVIINENKINFEAANDSKINGLTFGWDKATNLLTITDSRSSSSGTTSTGQELVLDLETGGINATDDILEFYNKSNDGLKTKLAQVDLSNIYSTLSAAGASVDKLVFTSTETGGVFTYTASKATD